MPSEPSSDARRSSGDQVNGRGDWIRTSDLLNPIDFFSRVNGP